MSLQHLPPQAVIALLQDAARRDPAAARRAALLELLWDERFLDRAQLIARLERKLGKGCFGGPAWEDTFYRDMRAVKWAFRAAGYHLAYSRRAGRGGYYLAGEPPLSASLSRLLESSAAEVDERQVEIFRRLSPAERFRQGCAVSDAARRAVAYRIWQENPGTSEEEATRRALQRSYSP